MIAGYLSDKLVAKADVRNLSEPSGMLDRRSTRIIDNKVTNPLDLIRLQVNLPQVQATDQNYDNRMRDLFATHFISQIDALGNPPNIDVVEKIKSSAQTIRMHYSLA